MIWEKDGKISRIAFLDKFLAAMVHLKLFMRYFCTNGISNYKPFPRLSLQFKNLTLLKRGRWLVCWTLQMLSSIIKYHNLFVKSIHWNKEQIWSKLTVQPISKKSMQKYGEISLLDISGIFSQFCWFTTGYRRISQSLIRLDSCWGKGVVVLIKFSLWEGYWNVASNFSNFIDFVF